MLKIGLILNLELQTKPRFKNAKKTLNRQKTEVQMAQSSGSEFRLSIILAQNESFWFRF